MTKETFTNKLIKRFYGITGPLDEHKRQEVDRIGNIAFVYLFYVLLLSNLIAILISYRSPELVGKFYPAFLFGLTTLLSLYVSFKGKMAGVAQFDTEELTAKEKKQIHHIGLKAGLHFGLWMYVSLAFLELFLDQTDLIKTLTSPRHLLSSGLAGLLFGLVSHLTIKLRQRQSKD